MSDDTKNPLIDPSAGHITVKVPDHFECLPPRAGRSQGKYHIHPLWSPTSNQGDNVATRQAADWSLAQVRSVEPVHHVTFRRKQSTFSFLSRKNGHTQTGESPWELLRAQELEVDPMILDFQLGGLRIEWTSMRGARHYTLDNVATSAGGHVVAEEVKASASYFADPEYSPLMIRAQDSLAAVGIRFNKVDAEQMRANRRRRFNIAKAFDDRFAAFGAYHLDKVQESFAANASGVPLGKLVETLDVPNATARQLINAMMCCRHLTYDFSKIVDNDTPIFPAPKASKSAPDIRAIRR